MTPYKGSDRLLAEIKEGAVRKGTPILMMATGAKQRL